MPVKRPLFWGGYASFGRLFGWLWRLGLIRPGGNRWHRERAGDHAPREDRPLWLHAASLGEVQVAAAYVDRLRDLAPLYVTVQTTTGHHAAAEIFGRDRVAFAPLDRATCVRRFLDRVRPCGLVVFETEIWPNTLRWFDGPVWYANASLSPGSFGRLSTMRSVIQPLWRNVRAVFAVSDADLRRFVALGVDPARAILAGQVKQFGTRPGMAPDVRRQWRERLGLGAGERLWVCGSARSDEFELVLRLFDRARRASSGVRILIAPRHLRNVDRVVHAADRAGLSAVRVSELNGRPTGSDLFVLDTHGDLRSLYAGADLVLLGGTLAPHGGHNPNEAAAFGVPVVTGPYTENIDPDLALLAQADLAYRLEDPEDFVRLAPSLDDFPHEDAARRLAALLDERPHPADLLARSVSEELNRDNRSAT